MTQSFIQPKGTLPTQTNIGDIQNQYAKLFANQQLQGQAQQEAEAQDPLRQTVNELVKNKLMQDIVVPQKTTIQDIIKAGKTPEGLELLGSYLGGPQITRTWGGYRTYNPKTDSFESTGQRISNDRESILKERQMQALALQKEQNDLAQAMANAYNQKDIHEADNKMRKELAEQELAWKKEEAALDRALKREQMAQHERLTNLIHGGGSATGGAAGINNLKMTAAERKSYTDGKTTLANIDSGLKALEENPKAYTFAKGILPTDITNRLDPEGVATRTQIDNITAVYRKWLTGAQMSDKERKAYERFLPAPTDNYNIVKAKLNGMKGAIERSNNAILENYGVTPESIKGTQSKDSLGLGI